MRYFRNLNLNEEYKKYKFFISKYHLCSLLKLIFQSSKYKLTLETVDDLDIFIEKN